MRSAFMTDDCNVMNDVFFVVMSCTGPDPAGHYTDEWGTWYGSSFNLV